MAADFSITGEVKLNSDPAEKATSKWTVAAGQLIADFAKKAASSLKSVVKSGLDYNAQMESYLTNFKVMLGDEQLAAEKLEEIRRMAASTPFSLSDLTEGTQTLLQFGVAADDTTGVLKRLGDISLGNADKLQTLVRAYGKMSSAQKVTLENVNMMIDAGFNPLNQICDATGESMSALYKRISDGKVSFNELEAAVAAATSEGGQFYNGMLEASQTFNGRLSTLKDNVAALTGELTSGLFSALGDIIVKANELVVSITEDDSKMAALKETIGVLTAAVVAVTAAVLSYKATVAATTTITALCTAATTAKAAADKAAESGAKGLAVAQAALNAVMKANTVGIVVSAVAALAAGLVTAYHTSETFRNIVNGAFQAVASIAQSTIGAAIGWLDKLSYRLNSFLGKDGYTGFDSYDDYKASKTPAKSNTTTDADRQRRQQLHESRVQRSQASTGTADAAAKSTKQATADIIKSISDTTTAVKDGVTTTTETVTETLSNGTTHQKQTITSTSRQLVDGVLKDVKTVETIAADGKRTVNQTMETVRDVVNTVTATTTALADGVKTTTQTVTKTLADGTTEQQRVITQTQDKVIDGALRTVETVKTIAADGTEQVAETIKDSAAKTLDDLWKEIQDRANEGILGTVDTLWEAVKSGDWVGIGKWVASTLYSGLTADQKQQLTDYALSLVDGLNGVLGDAAGSLAQTAWSLGQTLFEGITGKFGDISSMAVKMGGTLKSVFGALKVPLATAAKAISAGLSGGLLSMFPAIYAGFAGMIGTIGAAVEGMLAAISAALTSTLFGIPAGLVVAAAAVALGVALAAIVSKLGGGHRSSGGSGGSGGGGGGSSGLDLDTPSITDGSNKLTDTIDANTAKLTEINKSLAKLVKSANALVLSDNMAVSSRVAASGTAQIAAAAGSYREGDTNITQNIYSKAHTAADLQREARWEADRGLAQKR
ncbi:tape measure protein [Faecalibacterium prausnitzii]|uniref:tape measure protein n=1 Tax=Faecalibacterium prausnitzii TaxID=853 RepID=UPI003D9FC32D